MKKLLILFVVSILLTSCASSGKLLQKGRFDDAIEKSVKKLGKEPSNHDEIIVLRKALKLADKTDREAIDQLKLSGQPSIWESVYNHYLKLNQRQELVSRLPDRVLAKVNFKPVNYIPEIAIAKRNTANYFDAKGEALLNAGNRFDARKAWEYFQKEKKLFPETPGLQRKISTALKQGKTQILIRIRNKSHQVLPKNFNAALKKINVRSLNRQWLQFNTNNSTSNAYNFVIVLNIKNIEVSPELIDRQIHMEKKTIDDGWKYVLDARGNVKKDSAGNDIKIKRYRIIRCRVTNIHLAKSTLITGTLDYYNYHTEQLIKSRPISSQFAFDYRYATAKGNLQAVSPASLELIRRTPVPFPSDLQMIFDTNRALKTMMMDYIRQDIRLFK